MAYESRIYIMRKSDYVPDYAEEIAMMRLANCDFADNNCPRYFRDLFKKEIDFKFTDEFDNDLSIDRYGDKCKYADIKTVLDYLDKMIEKYPNWRVSPAIAMLKVFSTYDDPNIIVVHYGY